MNNIWKVSFFLMLTCEWFIFTFRDDKHAVQMVEIEYCLMFQSQIKNKRFDRLILQLTLTAPNIKATM